MLTRHRIRYARAFILPVLISLISFVPVAQDAEADGEVAFDDGPLLLPPTQTFGDTEDGVGWAAEAVAYITDCRTGEFRSCGDPAGSWAEMARPVEFCTHQHNRPEHLTAQQFRDYVRASAEMWNNQGIAVGIRYSGDCAGSRWQPTNEQNEIGFDDDRAVLSGTSAGIAIGRWIDRTTNGEVVERVFVEFDVVIDPARDLHPQCFQSVVHHEIGHVLGLGHSDVLGDLMFPTFDPGDLHTCRPSPSADEVAALVDLYGANGSPKVSLGSPGSARTGSAVTLEARAFDPESAPLTYQWVQLSGPRVDLATEGPVASFVAPSTSETLSFAVWARDPYLAWARDTASVQIADTESALEEEPPTPEEAEPLPGVTQPEPVVPPGFDRPISQGVTLAPWPGGTVAELASALAEAGALTGTLFIDGRPVVLTPGAPRFVNVAFLDAFADGAIPEPSVILVFKR